MTAAVKPPPHFLAGCVLPMRDGRPILLSASCEDGAADPELRYIVIFSSADKLTEGLARMAVSFDQVVRIDDEQAFLNSLPVGLGIMKDPYWTADGVIRFEASRVAPAGQGALS
jgi:hypothetical protein